MPHSYVGTLLLSLCFSVMLTQAALAGNARDLQALSPAQADAIVAAQEAAKAERKQRARDSLNAAKVLSEGSYTNRKGDTVIVREIEAPVTVPHRARVVRRASAPQERTERPAIPNTAKAQAMLMLNATIYEGPQTYVTWQHEGAQHSVVLPVDWEAVSQIRQLETRDVDYMLMHSVHHAPDDANPPQAVTQLDAITEEPLKSLLAHYRAHANTLKIQAHNRAALQAARERYRAANPPKPETHILNFYDLPASTDSNPQP